MIFNDFGSAAAPKRSRIGQLQFWKSHCRSGNSNIFGVQRAKFIMISNALLGGVIPAADFGPHPQIGSKLLPLKMPIGSIRDQFGASLHQETRRKSHVTSGKWQARYGDTQMHKSGMCAFDVIQTMLQLPTSLQNLFQHVEQQHKSALMPCALPCY